MSTKKKEIVGVIPVKGESERIKNKNLRSFSDTNLFELKLSQLKGVVGFSDMIVSSEDPAILEMAQKSGCSVHERDPKYSTSEVPMSEVYSTIASEVHGEHIAWINVTNPLAVGDIYTEAIRQYQNMPDEHDCLLSVYELQDNIIYKSKPLNFRRYPWPRSQDLEPVLVMSFVINILQRKDLIRWGSCVGEFPYFFIRDPVESWDIDFQLDFDFCQMIYEKRNLSTR